MSSSSSSVQFEDISFLPFHSPPSTSSSDGWSQWAESLEAIDYDLSQLLRFPHNKFWAQVIHDKSLSTLLDTYLQHALRPYEEAWSVPSTSTLELLRNIHRRIFMVFLRMSTNKEDQTNQYSPTEFGDLIHTHSLFTIPRLLDLCSLYGTNNVQLLTKMIDNVISKQPLYLKDLEQVMASGLQTAFSNIVDKTNSEVMSLKDVMDVVLYFTDLTHTLSSLLTIFPSSSSHLWKTGLIERLVNCYESSFPSLLSNWKLVQYNCENSSYIKQCIRLIKHNTVKIVHTILMSRCHDNEGVESENQILTCLGSITSGKMFMKEFEKQFSLKDTCLLLSKALPNLDVQYILEAVCGETTPTEAPPTKSTKVPNVKEMVEYIREMLPHLEDDFIKKCLKEFHYNQEVVLHHLLEGTLPPHLQYNEDTPTIRPQTPPITPPPLEEGQSILDGRMGVYDYDDFDLLRRKDIDLSRVHVGKKHETISDILSDRSHVQHMKGVGLDLLPLNYDEYDDEYDDTYDSHNIGSLEQETATDNDIFTIKRLNVKGQFSSRGHKWVGVVNSEEEEEDEEKEIIIPVEPIQLLQRPITPDKIKQERTSGPNKMETAAGNKKSIKGGGGGKKGTGKNKKSEKEGANLGGKREEGGKKGATPGGGGGGREEGGKKGATTSGGARREWKGDKTERGEEGKGREETERQRAYNERHKGSRANHNRRALADRKRGAAGFY